MRGFAFRASLLIAATNRSAFWEREKNTYLALEMGFKSGNRSENRDEHDFPARLVRGRDFSRTDERARRRHAILLEVWENSDLQEKSIEKSRWDFDAVIFYLFVLDVITPSGPAPSHRSLVLNC